MPPIEEDKKYCRRYGCPLPGLVTIETFYKGVRQQAVVIESYTEANVYKRILEYNGYEHVQIESTEDFVR